MRVLNEIGHFPPNARHWKEGDNVFEGHFLELLPNGSVTLWWQRHQPINPNQLAEKGQSEFVNMNRAVEEFVSREWAQGHIDGIPIFS